MRLSIPARLALLLILAMLAGVGAGFLLASAQLGVRLAGVLALLACVIGSVLLAHLISRPLVSLLRTLSGSVAAFRDGDFSFSLANRRHDEFGELIQAHNELGRVLREERQSLFQRELLLHTLVQNAPTAMLLANARGHIVHANLAARHLLRDGRRIEGLHLDELLLAMPVPLREALQAQRDGLFGVEMAGQEEVFHLATRGFRLNGQSHRLYLLRHMTREISRQEVASWKKVIRVISHELNNSLAPISSLAHSGRTLAQRGDQERVQEVLATIGERARHLADFIRGYAAFAKLPSPRVETIDVAPFFARLAHHYAFELTLSVDDEALQADPAQLEQALINLLKNAHESGSPAAQVAVQVSRIERDWRIDVSDRGPGMSEQVLASALVPFYSTKRSGTGLGLALAREIIEAHGGRLALANREGGGLVARLTLPRHSPVLATTEMPLSRA